VKNALLFLDPNAVHAIVTGKPLPEGRRRDEGFSLIETLAAMAIIAIISLGVVPQFNKYMERAAVQNVISDITSAQILVDSDFSLTGSSAYTSGGVKKSVDDTTKNTETTLVSAVNTATNTYTITATSTAVKNYNISFSSATGKLSVVRK
jgi:type IV pilus assembly protein PilA